MAIPLFIHRQAISTFATNLFAPIRQDPKTELIIVMVIVPGCLNMLNFCLFDTVLKRKYKYQNDVRMNSKEFQPLSKDDINDQELELECDDGPAYAIGVGMHSNFHSNDRESLVHK